MKLITAEQMRRCDRIAIDERNIAGADLMERAGAAVARCALEMIGAASLRREALLFAGKGNNGGDAFVAARYLESEGVKTRTVLLAGRGDVKGDAGEKLRRLEASGAAVVPVETLEDLEALKDGASGTDLVIDGILGTGVRGKVTGLLAEAIFFVGGLHKRVISIDLPSGIDATSGEICGVAVRAAATVTMGLPTIGLVRSDGLDHSGRIRVASIGFPGDLLGAIPSSGDLIVEQDLYGLFPPRRRESHKGDYGHVLVVAGSPGMTGAACLAAAGALRGGAGLVTVAVPKGLNPVMEAKLTEAMTLPLPETADGELSIEAGERILAAARGCDVVVIGPGLSRGKETAGMVRGLVGGLRVPMLIDADGLNALGDDPGALREAKAPIVITPHPGEMARLLGWKTPGVMGDRLVVASSFAREFGVTVTLKGARTVVAFPGGEVFVNASGNPGMATGGSGDLLAGLIAAFWAQGMSAGDAARAGVFVHGDAGDRVAARLGERSMIATDMEEALPRAIEHLVYREW